MTDLTNHKLSDLYTLASGISSSKDQAGHGQPFLSFSTAFNNVFLPDTLPDLMASNEKEQEKHSIKCGDVFLTRTSEVVDELAISSVAVKDYPSATFSGFLKRLRPKESGKAYPKYMALYLRSQLFRKAMDNNAVMTLRASFNEAIFSYLDLWLPDYNKQVEIGDLLYAIEEKMALNNKINAELEAMAKLIYDYWFVQFDFPNEEGKPYKSSGGKMVWCDQLKREIPKGWEPSTLGEFALVKKGSLITEETANAKGEVKVVSAGTDFSYFHDAANFPEYTVTVSASGASAGFINFWFEPIFANDCTVVRGDTLAKTAIAHNFLKMRQSYLYQQARGSAQPHVYPKDLQGLKMEFPCKDVVSKFGEVVCPLYEKMQNNQMQNQALLKLRDWLLPMLMNGQVTVSV
ncbi:restriction endonuclease subunit S [Ruegeria arenilitoris]|uniref:restriction endonuclease subunit S n=1 Tax=Ruegeria arenilitoris TaxID=1173585 RepID=UPI001C2CA54C|nr:restriction endonuclease subunit S [Ruegeria arenilitoris]